MQAEFNSLPPVIKELVNLNIRLHGYPVIITDDIAEMKVPDDIFYLALRRNLLTLLNREIHDGTVDPIVINKRKVLLERFKTSAIAVWWMGGLISPARIEGSVIELLKGSTFYNKCNVWEGKKNVQTSM